MKQLIVINRRSRDHVSCAFSAHQRVPFACAPSITLFLHLFTCCCNCKLQNTHLHDYIHRTSVTIHLPLSQKNHGAMAPTETKILSDYLLVPAQLPAIISLQEFIDLFPRSLQSSPQVRNLYRDLQTQRNAVVDSVAAEIEAEAKRGRAMRQVMIKAKREEDSQENDDEAEIEQIVRFENHFMIVGLHWARELTNGPRGTCFML